MLLYLVGIDGLSANILLTREAKKRWPNFHKFFLSGIYGRCECEEEYMFTGPSWTSIYTGQPVNVHKVTDLWGRPINNGRSFSTVKEPYIWDILNNSDISCGVVTMPITYPAKKINGFMIAGFPSPKLSVTGAISVPDDFIVDHSQTIRQTQEIKGMGYSFHDLHTLEEDIEMLKESELQKMELVPRLLEQQEVHALLVQYSCLDRIGHELNNYARRNIQYDHNRILEMYDWFDSVCLPQILNINADYKVMISDHGWNSFTEERKGKRFDGAVVYGEHDLGGIMAFNGPDIPEETEIFCKNIDLLPTILHALDLPQADVAGKSILTKCSELEDINKLLSGLGYIE